VELLPAALKTEASGTFYRLLVLFGRGNLEIFFEQVRKPGWPEWFAESRNVTCLYSSGLLRFFYLHSFVSLLINATAQETV